MEINNDFEKLYSCSKWCKKISPENAVKNHIDIISNKSIHVRDIYSHESFFYKSGNPTVENKFDFFPSLIESKRLFIFIHGGYWQQLNLASSVFMADFFVKKKWNFASIGYDLCPNVTLDCIVRDIRKAVKSIINHYPDINEIYIAGHSAGAHLALTCMIFDEYEDELLFEPDEIRKIHGLVLISGIFDIVPICYTSINKILNLTIDDAWRLSPLRIISNIFRCKSNFKVLLIVGEYDSPSFIEQSSHLYEVLRELKFNVNIHYEMVKGVDHFELCHNIGDDVCISQIILDFLNFSGF